MYARCWFLKMHKRCPSWVAQLIGVLHHAPKGRGSIPSQDIYWGRGFDSQSGPLWEATHPCFSLTQMFLSPSLSLSLSFSLPSSLSKINLKWIKERKICKTFILFIQFIPYKGQKARDWMVFASYATQLTTGLVPVMTILHSM